MSTIRDRVKEHVPSVLLTLLSIVQALALELWWSHLQESPDLYQGTLNAAVAWAQAAGVLIGIIVIWVVYASSAMRFRWLPGTGESIYPFVIGVGEFLLVELSHPALLGPWLLTLAGLFAIMNWVSHTTLRRARAEPENQEVFSRVAPARLRDFTPVFLTITGLIAAGAAFLWRPPAPAVALPAALLVNGLLLWQLYNANVFWNRTTSRPAHSP